MVYSSSVLTVLLTVGAASVLAVPVPAGGAAEGSNVAVRSQNVAPGSFSAASSSVPSRRNPEEEKKMGKKKEHPVSAFDQYLDEDPQVNRIDDSVQLFTQICSNKLLKKVHLVLFLNKTDILKRKLSSGIRVNKYITSYGNRPNEFQAVTNYFRAHFVQVHRANNHSSRVLYVHLTNVVVSLFPPAPPSPSNLYFRIPKRQELLSSTSEIPSSEDTLKTRR